MTRALSHNYFAKFLQSYRLLQQSNAHSAIEAMEARQLLSSSPALISGGFESPAVGAGAYQYNPSNAGWAFAGHSGVSGNNSGFTAGNPPAPEGGTVAFLQLGDSLISQSIPGWSAGSYTLTLSAAQRENYQSSRQDFQVLVDGAAVATFRPRAVRTPTTRPPNLSSPPAQT